MKPTERRVGALVQARTGSSRFPGKVFADIAGRPLLGRLLDRLKRCRTLGEIVVATSSSPADRAVLEFAEKEGVRGFAGSEQDVQKRFLDAAEKFGLDVVVRICGDCPFIDPEMIDRLVTELIEHEGDYAEPDPATPAAFEGMEALTVAALRRARTLGDEGPDREHVTRYMRNHPEKFRLVHPVPSEDVRGTFRLSVDNRADLAFARAVFDALHRPGGIFSTAELVRFLKKHPEVRALNEHVRQKKTDAREVHVAFFISDPDRIESSLPAARELNERRHCGIVFLGLIGEEEQKRLAAMGYRAREVTGDDAAEKLAKALKEFRIDALLLDPSERPLADAARSEGVPVFDFSTPAEKIVPNNPG